MRRQAKIRSNLPFDVLVTAIVCFGAFFAGAASADSSLTPHTAEYKVKVSVVSGTLTTELRETPIGYSAHHVIRPTGLSRAISRGSLSEKSEFAVVPEGLRPKTYSSQDTISREKTNASIHFDWDTGEARGMVNGEDVVSMMDSIAHDRVSIQYQLMHDLLSSRSSSDYTMFEIDRLRPVTVSNIGSQTVKVGAGEFEVIGIQHQADGSKRRTTLWVAEALDYLPVVIEQHRLDKLKVRATLIRYTPASEPGSAR